MASVYETASESFTVERLRAADAQFPMGAVRPGANLPEPIALASGPNTYEGPSGAVGAGEIWNCTFSIPGVDVIWVLVSANLSLSKKTGVGMPQVNYMKPYATSSANSTSAPYLGAGANLTEVAAASSGGTYVDDVLTDVPGTQSLWIPYPPSWTINGWSMSVYTQASAGAGFAIDDLRLYLPGVRFLGFPLNLWGTGLLWAPSSSRGS